MASDGEPASGSESTDQAIEWAYRLFLDREPEDQKVVAAWRGAHDSTRAIRQAFLESDEFRANNPWAEAINRDGDRQPMDVEVSASGEELADIWAHVVDSRRRLGLTEPYWSVLPSDDYRLASIGDNLSAFEASGRVELERHLRLVACNEVDISRVSSVLEYGCGVGRVTRWLADRFDKVHAFDVSAPHLKIAGDLLRARGCDNVEISQVGDMASLAELPEVDMVYSMLALQYHPPPVMSIVLTRLLDAIAPGGIAIIQLPTYWRAYSFSVDKYISNVAFAPQRELRAELHLLPQRHVHRSIAAAGCMILEVVETDAAGPAYVFDTLLVSRPSA